MSDPGMSDFVDDPGRVPPERKSATAYRTISEVSEELAVPQHVLRFWETKFSQIRPLKRGGGRRYYRPEDVRLLRQIQKLLYEDGYTIKGVQRLLRESRSRLGQPAAASVEELPLDDGETWEEEAPAEPRPAAAGGTADLQPELPAELRAQLTDLLEELQALRQALAEEAG